MKLRYNGANGAAVFIPKGVESPRPDGSIRSGDEFEAFDEKVAASLLKQGVAEKVEEPKPAPAAPKKSKGPASAF